MADRWVSAEGWEDVTAPDYLDPDPAKMALFDERGRPYEITRSTTDGDDLNAGRRPI
jgi:hypothetical protein